MAKDREEHFKRLAMCDYDPYLSSTAERGNQGPNPSAQDRVGSNASPPHGTTSAHGTEEVSSSASVASASGWTPVSAFASDGV